MEKERKRELIRGYKERPLREMCIRDRWVPIDQMLTYSTEREMHPVYQKLIDKLRLYG